MPDAEQRVVVCGSGVLADAIAAAFATTVHRADDPPELDGRTALVLATDGWDHRAHPSLRRACAAAGIPWLPVHAELGHVLIGPRQEPGRPGCARCVARRRAASRDDPAAWRALHAEHANALADRASSWLTELAAELVAALVVGELGTDAGRVLRVGLRELDVGRHRFLPDPHCPECGDLPADAPAPLELAPRPTQAPGSTRAGPVPDLDRLRELYVDDDTGLLHHLRSGPVGGVITATVQLGVRDGDTAVSGSGLADNHRQSMAVAALEALERYGGLRPGGSRTAVRGSYRELAGQALDPRTLGGYAPSAHARPGFPYRPFDADDEHAWVWAYSFASKEPILVPESSAYYGAPRDSRPFAGDSSNGCALGTCREEAILHGILEVIERDAFLITWYCRLPVPRLDITAEPAVALQAAAVTAETGYRPMLFDTTMEHGIPSVLALAVHPEQPDPGPAVVCSASARPRHADAALGAVRELGVALAGMRERLPAELAHATALYADPGLISTPEEHSLLYALPAAARRLRFLRDSPHRRGLTGDTDAAFRTGDLTEDLTAVLDTLAGHGLEVIVLEQTTPEHRAAGLSCVKVLIPGMVPMTFGPADRRIHGLPRLLQVPRLLGHRAEPMREEELNPHPHPFP